MRRAGRSSWQVVEDEPTDLHLVLFVRDGFRLAVGSADPSGGPGPLVPAVPDLSDRLDDAAREAAAAAWPTWWRAALDLTTHGRPDRPPGPPVDPPDFASLAATPQLRAAARAAFRPFLAWWSPPWDAAAPPRRAAGRPPGLPGARGRLIDLHLHRRTVHDVVDRLERELGRRVRPFDVQIAVLAVDAPDVVRADAERAVVSGELIASEPRYAQWLHAVLGPLA